MTHVGLPLLSAVTVAGKSFLREMPSAFDIMTEGIEIEQRLQKMTISAEGLQYQGAHMLLPPIVKAEPSTLLTMMTPIAPCN
jgi:hypothetical protein